MKYLYNNGVGKTGNQKLLLVPLILVLIGIYLGFNTLSPLIFSVTQPVDKTANLLKSQQPEQDIDRLYIPKINTNIVIAPIGTDETTALDLGAVSRSNQNGNPKAGGNYVLVAERFSLRFLPTETFNKSPFYNLGNLQVGDDLFVDYKGTRFAYKIDAREIMDSTNPRIEGTSEQAKLTLYSAEMKDEGKREIITASQIGKVVWTSGAPKVEPITN